MNLLTECNGCLVSVLMALPAWSSIPAYKLCTPKPPFYISFLLQQWGFAAGMFWKGVVGGRRLSRVRPGLGGPRPGSWEAHFRLFPHWCQYCVWTSTTHMSTPDSRKKNLNVSQEVLKSLLSCKLPPDPKSAISIDKWYRESCTSPGGDFNFNSPSSILLYKLI